MSDVEQPKATASLPPIAAAPRWVLWAAGAIVVATLVGAALSPYLAVHHPLWLLALNPWQRHQILVAPRIAFVPFVALVTVRNLFTCLVAYALGKHYGARGTAYIVGHSPETGRTLVLFEQLFGRFSSVLLVVVPGLMTSVLAGTSGLTRLYTLALSGLGIAVWAGINHRVGGVLAPWTGPLLDFLREHVLEATLVAVALVFLYQAWTRRRVRSRPRQDEDER
jgi:membrane protein DedA with SNARE-associated domain